MLINPPPDYWVEMDLAWDLLDTVGSVLPDRIGCDIFTVLGAGAPFPVICALLEIVVGTALQLPQGLRGRLASWLEAYARTDDAARLRELLNATGTLG